MCRECAHHPELVPQCRRSRSEALGRVYLFRDLSPGAMGTILENATEIRAEPGEWLFFQEERAESFFLLLEGDLALSRLSPDGEEVIVAIVGPGELFAEDLLLVEAPRHGVSARPLGSCRLVRFDHRRLRPLLSREPALVPRLASTMHRRNALLLEEVERLSISDASQRLIRFLESQTPSGGDRLPLRFPKRVLASRLSIRPETLSRVLARLKGCGRVREVDEALVLVPDGGGPCSACDTCPVRLWGCPGPAQAAAGSRAEARAAGMNMPDASSG